ncbi:MAG: PD40 domain-containing protein [Anaerolineae bacterium]|nr:PD40 domain-containing protein [Anaerolineae bacterium]
MSVVGQVIGQYHIVERIGRGGMANVYRAEQESMGRDVAIKLLPAHMMQDHTFLERFVREVKVIAQLEHPSILPVYDYGQWNGQPFIVMRYVTGGTLADRIRENPNGMPLDEISRILNRIADALDFAHREGIIHRDIKPSNILLDKDGNPYLADFGVARVSEPTLQLTGSGIVGTPGYIAPEMSQPGGLTPLVDIYALGITLYQMLTGQLPYTGETPVSVLMAHVHKPIPDVRAYRPDLPVGAQQVIDGALAKHPSHRYQTAADLALGYRAVVLEEIELPETQGRAAPVVPPPVGAAQAPPPQFSRPQAPAAPPVREVGEPKAKKKLKLPPTVLLVGVLTCMMVAALGVLIWYSVFSPGRPEAIVGTPAGPVNTPTPTFNATAAMATIQIVEMTAQAEAALLPTLAGITSQETAVPPTETPLPGPGKIVYSCYINGFDQICLMDDDGTNIRQLTDTQATDWYASLGPDGQTIVFSSNRFGQHDIYSMDIRGQNIRRLTQDFGLNYSPTISPDGTKIAFASTGSNNRNQNIYVMDIDGFNVEQLTYETGENHALDPAWSPDGQYISFVSSRDGPFQLYVMNANGANPRILTWEDSLGGRNSWSPDGRQIAFYGGPIGDRQIFLVDVETGGVRQLTDEFDNKAPSFSPDGRWIVYASRATVDEDNQLWVMRADGSDQHPITDDDYPSWQPRWGP